MPDEKPFHLKHVPQRTCIACRQIKSKRELVRIVRTPQGVIEIDLTGKKAGRGSYLCPNLHCWKTGLKKDLLGYVLRTKIAPEEGEKLLEQGGNLFTASGS